MNGNNNKKISLLPGEMRRKEEEELRKKKKQSESIAFHLPEEKKKETASSPFVKPLSSSEKKKRVGFWRKIFGSPEERALKIKNKEEARAREFARRAEEKKSEEEKRKREEIARMAAKAAQTKRREEKKEIPVPLPPVLFKAEDSFKKSKEAIKIPAKKEHQAEKLEPGVRVSLMPARGAVKMEEQFSAKFLVFVISLGAVVLLILGAYFWMAFQLSRVKTEEVNISGKISSLDKAIKQSEEAASAAKILQERLGLLGKLLEGHVYWTNFFNLLEKNTVEGVYYSSFSADSSGGVVISARAANLSVVARELVALLAAKDFVSSVRINSATASEEKDKTAAAINFDINMKVKEGVFFK